jgi:D-alanyl-D-alanine endopeptidase (penicillin-binding protein 7)
LKRLAHAIAISLLALSLAPVAADAAPHKRVAKKEAHTSIVKRARVAKTFTAGRQHMVAKQSRSIIRLAPAKPSFGQMAGLHATQDDLDLRSSVALVIDQDSNEILLRKNESAVLPIASITKLMTGLVISEAKLPMDEAITISQEDVDTEKFTGSRLRVGATLTRGELMQLALMSSENRAAHALGRTYPGGLNAFVEAMNSRAKLLGMTDTRYVEPTGLSSRNQSSAQDLARLVAFASNDPMLRELTTTPERLVEVGNRTMQFHTTNRLVKNPSWEIGLQKTGYIAEAGQCLVMQAKVAGRKLIMVFLDSAGKLSRIADAERVRKWVETHSPNGLPSGNTIIRQVNG